MTEVKRAIAFYDSDFRLIGLPVTITKPVPPCWNPPEELDGCTAIQAVSNGVLVGQASTVYGTWHYNLVGGPSHLPDVGASHRDSLKEIFTFFSEAMLLSAAE
jgi:hypothetical protein